MPKAEYSERCGVQRVAGRLFHFRSNDIDVGWGYSDEEGPNMSLHVSPPYRLYYMVYCSKKR